MINLNAAWDGLFLAACAALQVNPEGAWANTFFREAWPENGTHHTPGKDQDVCYFSLSERSGSQPYDRVSTQEDTLFTHWQIPAQCTFNLYGPKSGSYAAQLRLGLMYDVPILKDEVAYDSPRAILRPHGIIPQIPLPSLITLPENIDGQWRQRWDFAFPFLYTGTTAAAIPVIEQPPNITIVKE